jgi:two-component system, probable response regulator PhcQ
MAAPDVKPSFSVLMVDDEPAILRLLARTLQAEGYRIVTTENPLEAIALVEGGGFDVVVSDMDMPKMGGLELLARLRVTAPKVLRILLTGRGSLAAAMRAINEDEVFRFLTKPWNADELRATMKQALARVREASPELRAGELAQRRRELLTALEDQHPGITRVEHVGGEYVLPADAARVTLMRLHAERLLRLWRV